jgi:hypothetical protein
LPFPGSLSYVNNTPFTSGGASFNNTYNASFDVWSGFSYSKVKDVTTAGFGNQYAAYQVPLPSDPLGAGAGGSNNYAVAYNFSPGDAVITLPANTRPTSIAVTNTTYAALSMRDGDSFAKKFGGTTGNDPDYFRLTILGRDASNNSTGSVEFYLADYRFTDNSLDYIVSHWTTVDLSSLGASTQSLQFNLESTDNDPVFGMNTPAYFALDDLAFASVVPEPVFLGPLLVFAAGFRRLRRRLLK